MSAAVAVVLLAPGAVAFVLLDATLRERDGARPPLALRCALAAGLGIGIASCAFFVALVLFSGTLAAVAVIDGALALAAAALCWARRAIAGVRVVPPPWSLLDRCLALALGVSAAAAAGVFAVLARGGPHGEMDAWLSWNVKARFLFHDPAHWRDPYTGYFGHADYPYFLPTAVAHGWRYLGRSEQAFPIAVAALFAAATVVLLVAALAVLRGRSAALLAGLCLLGTPGFASRAAWLYADVPLGYFLLATLVLLVYWQSHAAPRAGAVAWAGLALGLAAWTKNEGTLFLAALPAVGVVLLVRVGLNLRALGWFVLGAAGPLALLTYYKITVASRLFFVAGRSTEQLIGLLADPSRYATIVAAAGRLLRDSPSLWLALALPVFVMAMGPTPDPRARFLGRCVAGVVALIGTGFFFVYALTTAPLEWHLSTSLDRLLFDLWPSALLAVFLWTSSPTEHAERVPSSELACSKICDPLPFSTRWRSVWHPHC